MVQRNCQRIILGACLIDCISSNRNCQNFAGIILIRTVIKNSCNRNCHRNGPKEMSKDNLLVWLNVYQAIGIVIIFQE